MKKHRRGRWTALGLAVVMALSLTACGGKDTEETTAKTTEETTGKTAAGGDTETSQEETGKEQEKETTEASSSKKPAPTGELYTITRDDIDHLVTDFLKMQAETVLKADDKTLKSLEPIDLMDLYAGVFTTDERYKVVADYDANAFEGLKSTQDIFLASQRKLQREYGNNVSMYYHVGVSVTESNIKENGGFRYYGGTDAVIGAVVKFNFFYSPDSFEAPFFLGADPALFADSDRVYNSEEDVRNCPSLCVVLVNCGDDDWGIQYFVADIGNTLAEGEAFTGVLTNEDEKDAKAAITENQGTEIVDWKKVYLDAIESGELDPTEDYCLKDINGNGIPELYTTSSFDYYQGVICYIKRDGTVDYIGSAYGYTQDKIATGTERQGVVIDGIYQYNRDTGEYELIFDGYIEQDFLNNTITYQVNRQIRGEMEYKNELAAAWNPVGYSYWEDFQSTSEKTLIQAIAEYEDPVASHNDYFTLPKSVQESQAPQGSQTAGESQTPWESQTAGESQTPWESQTAGESQAPGESMAEGSQGFQRTSQDYILPDSGSRFLSESEIRSLSKDEMRLARNEVYARHGRKFDSEDLQAYFNSKPWYNGFIAPKDFDEKLLNEYEIANLDLIRAVEGD